MGVSGVERQAALGAVAGRLRCPVCAGAVRLDGGQLACRRGHRFDIARQGYVNLVAGRPGPRTGDTAEMVAAREAFLARGHYRPIADAIASLAVRDPGRDPGGDGGGLAVDPAGGTGRDKDGLVVDLAGGTGYYLASVLDSLAGRYLAGPYGVCLDLSAPALRRAARAHPRAAAVGADAWGSLPLADGSAGLLLSVFGPRNAAEITRVLAPGGTLIIAAPGADHLGELRGPLGLIGIDVDKSRRIADAFGGYEAGGEADARFGMRLDHDEIAALVGMGPNARHIGPETLAARIGALPTPVTVTADVQIRALRRSPLHPVAITPRSPLGSRLGAGARGDHPDRFLGLLRGQAPARPAESGPDRGRALRDQLDDRAEVVPAVGRPGVGAPPRAAVAARLVQRAGQRADGAQQLRPGGLAQPGQHGVDLGEQAGDLPEAARQLGPALRAARLVQPARLPQLARHPVRGLGEIGRDADHGVIRVLAAGAQLKGRAHAPAVGVQPLRAGQPVLIREIRIREPVLVIEETGGLTEHEAAELAGIHPQRFLKPGDVALAQQVKQLFLAGFLMLSGHRTLHSG
jgi:23S rRNA (guanine745-N1)-methyltransferase